MHWAASASILICRAAACWGIGWLPRDTDAHDDESHGNGVPPPGSARRHSVKPQLAGWDRTGHPSQVRLARFLAHVDAMSGPVLAKVNGREADELIVGFSVTSR